MSQTHLLSPHCFGFRFSQNNLLLLNSCDTLHTILVFTAHKYVCVLCGGMYLTSRYMTVMCSTGTCFAWRGHTRHVTVYGTPRPHIYQDLSSASSSASSLAFSRQIWPRARSPGRTGSAPPQTGGLLRSTSSADFTFFKIHPPLRFHPAQEIWISWQGTNLGKRKIWSVRGYLFRDSAFCYSNLVFPGKGVNLGRYFPEGFSMIHPST